MYDFRTLSPLDFENLVRDLLQAEFGLRFESFGPGRDLGIDFRFATAIGSAVVQAKHYPDAKTDEIVRAAAKENDKVGELKPKRYLFATSAPLTPPAKAKIQAALPHAPLAQEDIFGREDLNNLLDRHPEIEKQHFKLWLASTQVLERILHSGVYNRTQAEMDEIKAMVPKFVHNRSVPDAEAILEKHGALIIAGEPGIGKSTLARMLVWLHAEQDWKISVIDDISEAFEIADGNEKRLVFFDDFLGQVGLTRDLIRGMDQRFPPFFRRVKANPNLRFILTTRDYILAQAQSQSWKLDTAEVNATSFVLNVGHYTRAVRAQILFNHIHFSDLSPVERDELLADDFFLKIIDHRNFNPRLIDLLTTGEYVSMTGKPIRDAVWGVLENPEELWEKPYRTHLGDEARALMLALFFNPARVRIDSLERSFAQLIGGLGITVPPADIPARFRGALKELEGSVLAIQERTVSFSNPGIRDFLQKVVRDDKLLAPALRVLIDFGELSPAWDYYSKQSSGHSGVSVSLWANAAERMVETGLGSALNHLNLIMSMYGTFEHAAFLPAVKTAVLNLAQSEIEYDDAGLGQSVLEQLFSIEFPDELKDDARSVTSIAMIKMVADYGHILSLDDLESIGDSLKEYAFDPDAAVDAIRDALEAHAGDLSSTLNEIKYVSEVDDYEQQFNRLVSEYGAKARDSWLRFDSRKDEIMEYGEPGEEEGYGRRPPGRGHDGTASDDQIRSMFSGLKGD